MELNNSIPSYAGKPTVYLDQNILSLLVKFGLSEFSNSLTEKFQVVYSDETLEEIKRSKGNEAKYLAVLKELNAAYLKLVIKQPGFEITNDATLTLCDPFDAYEQYCENTADYEYIQHSMQQWLLKFSGGRKGDSIADIHAEQIKAFEMLTALMMKDVDALPHELQELLTEHTENELERFKTTLKELEKQFAESISDDKTWNGINDFRDHTKIGPKQLNNIKPPNVLKQIWGLYEEIEDYSGMDIDDFFRLKTNPIYPEKPYFNHQKVTGIYNMLNTLGYYPDSKVLQERRFVASMSDTSHASIGSFCNAVISNDKNFIQKARAAYEHLGVPTEAIYVMVNDDNKEAIK